jgi:HlyD family secretion protein
MYDPRPKGATMKSPRWLSACGAGAIAALGLLAVSGCFHKSEAAGPKADIKSAVSAVTIVKPARQTIVRLIEQPGYIRPYEQTPIYSKIAGYVQDVKVDRGSQVKKGDLLVKLWVPEMEQDVRAKEARVKQTMAEVTQSEEGLKAAEANVATATALVNEAGAGVSQAEADYQRWKAEFERGQELLARHVYDKQTLDEARNQFQQSDAGRAKAVAKRYSAEAALVESRAKRDKAKADVEAVRAKLDVAKAELGQAHAWLDYRDIRAPYDGVVTARNIHTGAFLQSSSSGSTNKSAEPLFVMMRMDIMRVTVQVPEYDAVFVKEGVPATVRFQALPSQEFTAKVTLISWSFDDRARTLMAEIHLPNTASGELRPGMYANTTIRVELPNVLTLPTEAILTDGAKSYAFRVVNGKAERTDLRPGIRNDRLVQVLAMQGPSPQPGEPGPWQSLTGAEAFVATNPGALLDGQAVEVKPAD